MKRMKERMERIDLEKGRGQPMAAEEVKRLRLLEVKQDRIERERKRNNVVIRGMKMEGFDIREGVKELWRKMGVGLNGVREIFRVGKVGREGVGIMVVKLMGTEEKRKIMEAKKGLRERN